LNDFITINGKLFIFIDRKCPEIKQNSKAERSLNGTLNIDVLSTQTKKEWTFNFEVDLRNLERLRSLWRLNNSVSMIDWDSVSYTVACTSQSFDENFIGEMDDSYWFNVTLEFKEI
jgi:hypothetical protein